MNKTKGWEHAFKNYYEIVKEDRKRIHIRSRYPNQFVAFIAHIRTAFNVLRRAVRSK